MISARARESFAGKTAAAAGPPPAAAAPPAYVVIISAPQRAVGRSANADALAAALVNTIQSALGPRQAVVQGMDVRNPAQAAAASQLLGGHPSARRLVANGLAGLPTPLLYAARENVFTKPGLVSLQKIVDVAEQVLHNALPPALMQVVLEYPQRHDLRFCDGWANALEAAEAPEARVSASAAGRRAAGAGGGAGSGEVGLEAALRAAGYGEGASAGRGGSSAMAAAAAVEMGGGPLRAPPPAASALGIMDGYTEMAVYESGPASDTGIPIAAEAALLRGAGGEDGVNMEELRAAIAARRGGPGQAQLHHAHRARAQPSIEDRIKTSIPLDGIGTDAQLRERDLIPDTSEAATVREIAQARRARHAGF